MINCNVKTKNPAMRILITNDDGKVTGKKGVSMISFKEPEGEVMKELPFEMDDGTPVVGDGKIRLDGHIKIKLDEFKDISVFAGVVFFASSNSMIASSNSPNFR